VEWRQSPLDITPEESEKRYQIGKALTQQMAQRCPNRSRGDPGVILTVKLRMNMFARDLRLSRSIE
jgi:hypothetical protein